MKSMNSRIFPFICFSLLVCLFMSYAPLTYARPFVTEAYRPHKTLIYYGYPSYVSEHFSDGSFVSARGDTAKAGTIFAKWDYIVFGAGLELSSHPDHERAVSILAEIHKKNPVAKVFGYVDVGVTTNNFPVEKLQYRIDDWSAMGVDGIFLDDAGYDYGVTRARLNTIVRYIHAKSLAAFANAWNPNDVMGAQINPQMNPLGTPTVLGNRDYYLLESFIIDTDAYRTGYASIDDPTHTSDIVGRMRAALAYRRNLGIKLMGVGTADFAAYRPEDLLHFFHMEEAAAFLFSLDGYGLVTTEFSSATATDGWVWYFPYHNQYTSLYTLSPTYKINQTRTEIWRVNYPIRLTIAPAQGIFSYQLP